MMALAGEDWLHRRSPAEWIRAGLEELSVAQGAFAARNRRGGLASLRRAAGMALNGALSVEPNPVWGRTYVDHLRALAADECQVAGETLGASTQTRVPAAVIEAAKLLMDTAAPAPSVVLLRTPAQDHALVEAARDIIAHAYTIVVRHGRMP
jgi:hypothetical protein